MRKFLHKKATRYISRYFGVPQYLILYVTNDCWMKCSHCFYNDEFKKTYGISGKLLTFEEYKKIALSVKSIYYLSITGGEPFMREDIEDIIKLFTLTRKVKRYQMPTSGYDTELILGKTSRILRENPEVPFRIHVSIDGDEETHDKIRNRKGAFRSAIETISGLRKLKKKFSHFDVSIATTISLRNQDIISSINDISENVLPDGEWCINLCRGAGKDDGTETDPAKYMTAHDLIDKRIKRNEYKGYSGHATAKWLTAKNAARRRIIYRIAENDYKGGGCAAGSILGVIYPDGSVYPCELLSKRFGNVRDFDYNFPALWNSEKADVAREWIQDTMCLCTHECTLSASFLLQPRTWLSVIKERIKL